MAADKNMNRDTALMDIYRVMRPGEPPTVEAASRCSTAVLRLRAL
jgi:DNA-directed RNA polymerase subunit beta